MRGKAVPGDPTIGEMTERIQRTLAAIKPGKGYRCRPWTDQRLILDSADAPTDVLVAKIKAALESLD